jgi:hypothetical protein
MSAEVAAKRLAREPAATTVPHSEEICRRNGWQIEQRRRGGRCEREDATRNKRREPTVMEVVADRWEPASHFVVSGVPGAPLWSGDRLRTPDTVLDRAGWKEPLRHVAGNEILSDVSQILLGAALGTRVEMLLAPSWGSHSFQKWPDSVHIWVVQNSERNH